MWQRVERGLRFLFPTPAHGLAVMVASVAELVLLGSAAGNVFELGGATALFAGAFTVWWWTSVIWLVWWLQTRRWAMAGLLLLPALVIYAVSWAVYRQSGRFVNWEAVEFAGQNFPVLWLYVKQQRAGALAIALGAATGLAVVGGWVLRQRPSGPPPNFRTVRRAWLGVTLLWTVGLLLTRYSWSLQHVQRLEDGLRNGVHPVVTLAASVGAMVTEERVEPVLTVEELTPLSEFPVAMLTNRYNVLFVTIESLHHDVIGLRHQGQEVMPMLNELARTGCHWRRLYSATTHTDYSTTTLFSGLHPLRTRRHLYFHRGNPWPKTLIYDVLKPAGYATAMISSQNAGWGGMDQYLLSPHLDFFYDPSRQRATEALWADNFADSQTATVAADWLRRQTAPFFLAVNFQSSHFPYHLPPDVPRPFQPAGVPPNVEFLEYPVELTEPLRNAYYNALRECDRQLGRLLAAVREAGLWERTIVVVCGDHGQAFHEKGLVTHAREPIEPVIRTGGVLVAPGLVAPQVEDYPVGLVDIVPTVLGLLGAPAWPGFQGRDVLATDRTAVAERALFFHTENPVTRTDGVLWAGRWKYVLDRHRRQESLYDVVADPGELRDLLGREPELAGQLRETVQQWRRRQLAYYAFPKYYCCYFPPAAIEPTP